MRIATFNLWNSPLAWSERLQAACEEICRIDADVVALQEVPLAVGRQNANSFGNAADFIAENTPNVYRAFRQYPADPAEGIAFVSKHAFISVEAGWETAFADLSDCGLRVILEIEGVQVAVTNVHLDYASVATRERQIVAVSQWIEAHSDELHLEILCGDFNSRPESSVHRFLTGQQTIRDQAASLWHDLASLHEAQTGMPPLPTLDFATNPRWRDTSVLELPARYDWILLRDCWPLNPPVVPRVELFGVDPTPVAGVVPSDHYGIFADVVP